MRTFFVQKTPRYQYYRWAGLSVLEHLRIIKKHEGKNMDLITKVTAPIFTIQQVFSNISESIVTYSVPLHIST